MASSRAPHNAFFVQKREERFFRLPVVPVAILLKEIDNVLESVRWHLSTSSQYFGTHAAGARYLFNYSVFLFQCFKSLS